MTDNSLTPAKDGVGSHMSVRLDSRTDRRLRALVDHFNQPGANGMPVGARLIGITPSHVVRYAIDQLHERELG